MEFLKSILENPFRILGASPLDDRRRLIELGEEAALLYEDSTEDQLNLLLNNQKRLEAEINWFPETRPEQIDAVLSYPLSGKPIPFPELHTNSPLAQFNACRVILEAWPITDTNSALALCKSMIQLDGAIHVDSLMEEINRDREKANFQLLNDTTDLFYRLDGIRHSAAQRIMSRLMAQPKLDLNYILIALAKLFKDIPSPLIEIMIGIYELSINDQIKDVTNELLRQISGAKEFLIDSNINSTAAFICTLLNKWKALTEPMRVLDAQKGIVKNETQTIFHDTREFAIILFNKHSKLDASYSIIKALLETFGSVPDMKAMLTHDLSQLDTIKKQIEIRLMMMKQR